MITQSTAARIWECYREIQCGEQLLIDIEQQLKDHPHERHEQTLRDAFGRRRDLQLGVPSGESSHRLFNVSPHLAMTVIRSHIAAKRAELTEANEQARCELDGATA